MRYRRLIKAGAAGVALVLVTAAGSCSEGQSSSQQSENDRRQDSYDRLVAEQPAQEMDHSPTRETINFWIETWSQPGKLAFVYLQGANGELLGYYVLEGLPVSYCAMLTPSYETLEPHGNGDGIVSVPAPGMDGAYYSGNQCSTYYGRDATTGTYVEYTAGLGINVLLFDEPMPRQTDVQPLGPSTIEDAEAVQAEGGDE